MAESILVLATAFLIFHIVDGIYQNFKTIERMKMEQAENEKLLDELKERNEKSRLDLSESYVELIKTIKTLKRDIN